MSKRMSKYEQDDLVVELCVNAETMDEDEWQEKYDSLDERHQMEVDDDMNQFADDAIGSPTWRCGTDFED